MANATAASASDEPETTLLNPAKEFTTITWVLIPIAIGLNSAGSFIANLLKLPLFMDNTGTMLLAIVAGPWAAAVTGAVSNVLDALLGRPVTLAFLPVPIAIGLAAGYLAQKGYFDNVKRVIIPAIVVTLLATIIATPIATYVFGGATGVGADVLTGVFVASGLDLLQSVASGQLLVNLVDKGGLTFVAYFIAKATPTRYLPPLGQKIFSQ